LHLVFIYLYIFLLLCISAEYRTAIFFLSVFFARKFKHQDPTKRVTLNMTHILSLYSTVLLIYSPVSVLRTDCVLCYNVWFPADFSSIH